MIRNFDNFDQMMGSISDQQMFLKPFVTEAQKALKPGDCFLTSAYEETIFNKMLPIHEELYDDDGEFLGNGPEIDQSAESMIFCESGSVMTYGSTEMGDVHRVSAIAKITPEVYEIARREGFALTDVVKEALQGNVEFLLPAPGKIG